ncbi:tetratricopeptide repeat protein [Microbacterium murale]|uniref:Tetratricopeptide (TPR) repeat protein n=1 Tax=Microbacterium murale TaxID=1081040 RepID=A0ABU0P4Q7_9MICO|nr:tetratricopeptide repeat protein [Microbacterium murale]MDQ0641887.1 tetratricopeptide (TPR) repeat protein [Microbacterium murale]
MTTWEDRINRVWEDAANELVDDDVIARIDAIAAERGADDARAEFERAGARDSAGRPLEAIVLYRRALALGLDAEHEPQAIIQLASSLRNVGETAEALELLKKAREESAESPYGDAIAAIYALTLASSGAPHRALSVALLALVPHLPRYHRSMTAYAQEIGERDT